MTEPAEHAVEALNHAYLRRYPEEAARTVARLSAPEIVPLLAGQPVADALLLWERIPIDVAARVLRAVGEPFAREAVNRSDPVRMTRILARMPEGERAKMLDLAVERRRHELEALARYPEDSAGALMDARFLPLDENMTVREVLQRLRRSKPRFTRNLFLVEPDGRLSRMVAIHELAMADSNTRLDVLARTIPSAVLATASRAEVVEQFDKFKLTDLPVVDVDGRLIGVIRYETLVDAVREQTSADMLTMVGASKDERALSKISFVVRKRLPWLQINLVTAFIAAAVVGIFEDTIAKFTALAVLLPVVAGQSGNTGAQALAVTMRGLALREIGTSHWRRVSVKEVGAGLINGIAVALTTSLGVWVWSSSAGLAFVIGVSMVISMVAAAFSGVVIPIALSSMGQDPAQSSSIILTTVTDVTGFLTFLGIATVLSGLL